MTVLQLDDELAKSAKAEAERRGTSLDAFVHQVLQQHIAKTASATPAQRITLPTHNLGGAKSGVNFDDGRALRELLDIDAFARC
jgi:hypothetical protein